jgi:WD40 repeat protein
MFFEKYKKIIFLLAFAIIVLILGYSLYALFFKSPAEIINNNQEISTTTKTGGLPIAETGAPEKYKPQSQNGLIPDSTTNNRQEEGPGDVARGGKTQTSELTADAVAGITSSGFSAQYYNKTDEKFYKLDDDGKITALSDKVFHSVEKITWSPDKNKAILEYPDGANIIYDFSTNKQITLPAHWKDFSFSPDGKNIVLKSMGTDPDNRWLAIINEDGTKAKKIESLGEKDSTIYPSWSPNNQTVAMYTEGIDFDRQEVFFIGLNGENFKSMVVEGRNLKHKWSPGGDKLLYSVYSAKNDMKPMLWLDNAKGDYIGSGRKNLNIETWADKCVFADNINIYCAVPNNLEEGAGLFPELAENTSDKLYLINSQTGLKKLIAVPDENHNIANPNISKDGRYLYFTDKNTEKLYKINLK